MHFKKSGSNPAAIAAILDANITSDLWTVGDNHSHVYEIDITPLDGSSTTFPYVTGSGSKYSGAGTGHNVVPQIAALVKLVTGTRGRSYRGRVYVPWVSETYISLGGLTGSEKANMQTAWENFLAAMDGDGAPLQVASYKLATSADVIAVLVENDIATQRRRNHRNSL